MYVHFSLQAILNSPEFIEMIILPHNTEQPNGNVVLGAEVNQDNNVEMLSA